MLALTLNVTHYCVACSASGVWRVLPRKLREFATSPLGDAIIGGLCGLGVFVLLYAARLLLNHGVY